MEKDKFLGNKIKRTNFKGIMPHLRGIPPAPNWANRFTALTHGNNLLYISNNYICNIDLKKKEFFQLININQIDQQDKPSIIANLNNTNLLLLSTKGYFIVLQNYNNFNKEDVRVYFKEVKGFYKFEELATPKSILNIKESNLLIIGDNKGQLVSFKYQISEIDINSISDNENNDIKLCYEINLGMNNYITDLNYFNPWRCLFVATFSGDFYIYKYSDDGNIVKLVTFDTDAHFKTIYSFDYIAINNILNLSIIDKNGSMFIYEISNRDEKLSYSKVLMEKNKFNDKNIEEKFVIFTLKYVSLNNSEFLLFATSNKGKIFYSTFNQSTNINNITFKELSDNPHSMPIFNILENDSKLYFISADWTISCFNKELMSESGIYCLGNRPKQIQFTNYLSKSLFLISEESYFYKYLFSKPVNGLSITLRKLGKLNEFKNIVFCKQANFNENIFAIIGGENVICIYDYSADVVLNKNYLDFKPKTFLFNSKRHVQNLQNRNNEKVKNAVNDLFSEKNEFELLYVAGDNFILIWDYINNKTNKIYLDFGVKECTLVPLNNENEDLLLISISKNHENIKINLLNQILNFDLFTHEIKLNTTEHQHFDYFLMENHFFIFIIENQHDLKIFSLEKEFLKLLTTNENPILENYSNYFSKYNSIQNGLNKKLFTELNFKGFSNCVITCLTVLKEYSLHNEQMVIRLAISQQDGVIKIYEAVLENYLKLILRYSINAHYGRITELAWLGTHTICSTAFDHSLKLWNINLCKDLDLLVEYKDNAYLDFKKETVKLTNNFIKASSLSLFQQSYKLSEEFLANFEKAYSSENDLNVLTDDIEINLFSLYKDTGVNFITASKVLLFELTSSVENSNLNKTLLNIVNLALYCKYFSIDSFNEGVFIEKLTDRLNITNAPHGLIKIENIADILQHYSDLDYLSEKYSNILKINFCILLKEKTYSEVINLCLDSQCFIDAIIIFKLSRSEDFNVYFNILERLRGFIYSKHVFQSQKILKITEILKNYFNKNN
jgi:hypothetical protein